MAIKLINDKSFLKNGINFFSSNDFLVGSPISYKSIGSGTYAAQINYNSSGIVNFKNIIINSNVYFNNQIKRYYFNFSSDLIFSNNYLSQNNSGVISINDFDFVSGITSSSGTVNFYDYELSFNDEINFPEYIISKKVFLNQHTNYYNAINNGNIILNFNEINFLKDYNDSVSGLIPGQDYYLSSGTGKITDKSNNFKLFKAITDDSILVEMSKIQDYNLYVFRKEFVIESGQYITIFDLFNSQESGQYRFFDLNNPLDNGILFIKKNSEINYNLYLETNSSNFVLNKDEIFKINIYLESGLIYFSNKTVNPINFKIYKEI